MAWLWIWIAAALEIVWALTLKASDGLTRLKPAIVTVVVYLASLGFLARGVKALPVGTSYAVWTGVGAAGTAIFGMALFGESREPVRIGFLALIAIGVVGLMVTEGNGPPR
jgi:quaternary ammonium compound-resistance protein SugE